MVAFQRIIRSKGSKVAVCVGGVFTLDSVNALVVHSKRQKKVFAFIDAEGNEGTVRSGRRMRRVDAVVLNTVATLSK